MEFRPSGGNIITDEQKRQVASLMQKSINFFEEALALTPTSVPLLVRYGMALLDQQRFTKSEQILLQASQLPTEDEMAHTMALNALASCRAQSKMDTGAKAVLGAVKFGRLLRTPKQSPTGKPETPIKTPNTDEKPPQTAGSLPSVPEVPEVEEIVDVPEAPDIAEAVEEPKEEPRLQTLAEMVAAPSWKGPVAGGTSNAPATMAEEVIPEDIPEPRHWSSHSRWSSVNEDQISESLLQELQQEVLRAQADMMDAQAMVQDIQHTHSKTMTKMSRELEQNKKEAAQIRDLVDPNELGTHLMAMLEAGKLVPVEEVAAERFKRDHRPHGQSRSRSHHSTHAERVHTAPTKKTRHRLDRSRTPSPSKNKSRHSSHRHSPERRSIILGTIAEDNLPDKVDSPMPSRPPTGAPADAPVDLLDLTNDTWEAEIGRSVSTPPRLDQPLPSLSEHPAQDEQREVLFFNNGHALE